MIIDPLSFLSNNFRTSKGFHLAALTWAELVELPFMPLVVDQYWKRLIKTFLNYIGENVIKSLYVWPLCNFYNDQYFQALRSIYSILSNAIHQADVLRDKDARVEVVPFDIPPVEQRFWIRFLLDRRQNCYSRSGRRLQKAKIFRYSNTRAIVPFIDNNFLFVNTSNPSNEDSVPFTRIYWSMMNNSMHLVTFTSYNFFFTVMAIDEIMSPTS